jgi:hypothetical protein
VLHSDSQNAEVICMKGSPKPKLHAYAKLIHDYLEDQNIQLTVSWIPLDLNLTADFISTQIDYEDYQVIPEAFEHICDSLQRFPDFDLFADSSNAKCNKFLSATYCPGTVGVAAFNYDWSSFGLAWIFMAPRLILRALNYAKVCKAHILILVPQWKHSYFYPALDKLRVSTHCLMVAVLMAAGCLEPVRIRICIFRISLLETLKFGNCSFEMLFNMLCF